MKRLFSFLSLLIALSMVMALPMVAMADEEEIEIEEEFEDVETEEEEADEEIGESRGRGKGIGKSKNQNKEWKGIKDVLEADKDELEVLKDELELEIEELETLLEAAEEAEDSEAMALLQAEIEGLKGEFEDYKTLMKQKIREMQQVMREKYTQEEWELLMENAESLEGIEGIEMLPAENILMPGKNLKFDVPPVIKEGRVLVPIRSISTALGAEVDWNVETKIATINYEGSVIEFDIVNFTVTVDDEPVELDVPAEVMEGRIVVPLRFIVENMGLDVEWEPETETVEITE
ncbi:MAG: copper amine oxidase N-terminal domain-containing protein [Gudongella sp.]|nr:copper amine oxidase N-terminal domain-containing protein [Gudongella sp.]